MYKIEKIECEPNDVIIFELNTHDYDMVNFDAFVEDVEQAFPKNKVILVPLGAINDVKIISSQAKFLTIEAGERFPQVQTVLLNNPEETGGKSW